MLFSKCRLDFLSGSCFIAGLCEHPCLQCRQESARIRWIESREFLERTLRLLVPAKLHQCPCQLRSGKRWQGLTARQGGCRGQHIRISAAPQHRQKDVTGSDGGARIDSRSPLRRLQSRVEKSYVIVDDRQIA